jgi:hypothetical protein
MQQYSGKQKYAMQAVVSKVIYSFSRIAEYLQPDHLGAGGRRQILDFSKIYRSQLC